MQDFFRVLLKKFTPFQELIQLGLKRYFKANPNEQPSKKDHSVELPWWNTSSYRPEVTIGDLDPTPLDNLRIPTIATAVN